MKKFLAEFLATFFLVVLACGAASFTGSYAGYLGVVGIAMIFGCTAAVLYYIFGHISGCHMNPAVSLAVFVTGKMNFMDFMGYVTAQFMGGILGGFALYGLSFSLEQDVIMQYQTYGYDLAGFGVNTYGASSSFLQINMWGALATEIFLTCVFVLAFLAVMDKKYLKNIAGIVIGVALAGVHLFGTMLTGTSVNPARSFGPALAKAAAGDILGLSQVWVFIAAPFIGGLLAAVIFILFAEREKEKQKNDEEVIETNLSEV